MPARSRLKDDALEAHSGFWAAFLRPAGAVMDDLTLPQDTEMQDTFRLLIKNE
jgi:hypothetical protein